MAAHDKRKRFTNAKPLKFMRGKNVRTLDRSTQTLSYVHCDASEYKGLTEKVDSTIKFFVKLAVCQW